MYDKYSDDLVGYVDFGDPYLNYASFKNQDYLATPVLVFYVTGLTSKLKFELGYLVTKGIQWNLYKTDTLGEIESVRLTEVSVL